MLRTVRATLLLNTFYCARIVKPCFFAIDLCVCSKNRPGDTEFPGDRKTFFYRIHRSINQHGLAPYDTSRLTDTRCVVFGSRTSKLFLIFSFLMPHARLSWPSCQLLGKRKYTVPYRIVSYARNYFFEENGDFKRLLFRFERVPEELR